MLDAGCNPCRSSEKCPKGQESPMPASSRRMEDAGKPQTSTSYLPTRFCAISSLFVRQQTTPPVTSLTSPSSTRSTYIHRTPPYPKHKYRISPNKPSILSLSDLIGRHEDVDIRRQSNPTQAPEERSTPAHPAGLSCSLSLGD